MPRRPHKRDLPPFCMHSFADNATSNPRRRFQTTKCGHAQYISDATYCVTRITCALRIAECSNAFEIHHIYGSAYSVYIYTAPFVRDAIFPHCMLVHVTSCSRDKTSRTERLNSWNQRNRSLKTVRKGRHYYPDGGCAA